MWESCDWRIGMLMQLAQEQQHWHELRSLSSAAVKVQELRCLPEGQLQLVRLQRHLWGAVFEEKQRQQSSTKQRQSRCV
jgi:hypothetical protein|eukprot:COSAG02_NODE_1824_length_10760_cov_8.583154_8_plen_79_part_00